MTYYITCCAFYNGNIHSKIHFWKPNLECFNTFSIRFLTSLLQKVSKSYVDGFEPLNFSSFFTVYCSFKIQLQQGWRGWENLQPLNNEATWRWTGFKPGHPGLIANWKAEKEYHSHSLSLLLIKHSPSFIHNTGSFHSSQTTNTVRTKWWYRRFMKISMRHSFSCGSNQEATDMTWSCEFP